MSHSLFIPRKHACISIVDFLARARALLHFLARPQKLFHSLILSFTPFLSILLSFLPLFLTITHTDTHTHTLYLSFPLSLLLARAQSLALALLKKRISWSLHRWRMQGVVNASNGGEDLEILWLSFVALLYYDVHVVASSYVSNSDLGHLNHNLPVCLFIHWFVCLICLSFCWFSHWSIYLSGPL